MAMNVHFYVHMFSVNSAFVIMVHVVTIIYLESLMGNYICWSTYATVSRQILIPTSKLLHLNYYETTRLILSDPTN